LESGFIGLPFGQLKARENSSELDNVPNTLQEKQKLMNAIPYLGNNRNKNTK
jgi:hypothetical protein